MISTLSLVFSLAVLAVGKDLGDEQVRTSFPADIIGCNKLPAIIPTKSDAASTTATRTESASIVSVTPWGQCGGLGYAGPTVCPAGWICTLDNPYFSTCLQATPTGLASGYTFVRADDDESYVQIADPSTTTPLLLTNNPFIAAQCQVTADGQLIQNATGTILYADVEPPTNSNATELLVSWSTIPSASGLFSLNDGAIAWASPTFTTLENAWIVCNDGTAFINFNYTFTAGCYAENLHSFDGSS